MRPGIRGSAEPDRPCLGGCGQLLMAAAWDAAHGRCPACWARVRALGGLHQEEVEEAAEKFGILRHDGRYPDFSAGYVAAAESRDQRIKRLVAVAKAGTKLMTAEVEVHNSGGELGALDHALGGLSPGDLDAGAEADPDVADTAWAIIAHHRQHRTAG